MLGVIEPVRGLTDAPVSPLRYTACDVNPYESSGLLLSMIPEGARVLDIGCGTGSLSSVIRNLRRAEVVGFEPHPERAEKARNAGLEVVTGVYDQAIAQNYGKFDVVLFADVLEHLVDPLQILQDVKSSLAQDGRVLASIPNVAHWTVRILLLAGQFDYKPAGIMDATHLRWFTRKGVRRLFQQAGFDINQFQAAAGGWMGVYHVTPLRFLSAHSRSQFLSKFCSIAPGLMGVQHVISARMHKSDT
jgi:methionine biosynthesis protein MetW